MSTRGFTLLELMIASAIGIGMLAGGMAASVAFQKRSVFEEQTMIAQVTGRAVKELVAADVLRAGTGMGNSPVTFGDGDVRSAVTVLTEPDLSSAHPMFPGDTSSFVLPPAPYLTSDVLQLWWGDTSAMVPMDDCTGGAVYRIREGNSDVFCTQADPNGALEDKLALIVNPTLGFGCHIEIHKVISSSQKVNANPGRGDLETTTGPCADRFDPAWTTPGWFTMLTAGSSYRVNWDGGAPSLEYDPPQTAAIDWIPVSRDVERMKIRQAVVDLTDTSSIPVPRWFPDPAAGRPAIDLCTLAQAGVGGVCEVLGLTPAPIDEDALQLELQRRVREVEVTLTIRSQRPDRDQFVVGSPLDEDGFPQDGFKRRTFTFRVHPRNFSFAGLGAVTP